jgi:hypothetical protein
VVVAEILGHSTGERVHRQPAHRADHAPKPGSVAEFSDERKRTPSPPHPRHTTTDLREQTLTYVPVPMLVLAPVPQDRAAHTP